METQKMTELQLRDLVDSSLAKADGIARLFFHASNSGHEHIMLEDLRGARWALQDILTDGNRANNELTRRNANNHLKEVEA